jgi:hypothetical protein
MKKYNVRKFNATGDGVHDDRAAIQSAIDATLAAGGGVVFFPVGDYVVGKIPPRETSDASFFINRVTGPLIFEGEGAASIIRMAPSSIARKENWALFRVVAPKNVSFHHLCLHGNRHKMTLPIENKTQIHCMLLEQAIDVTVQNVEFHEAVDVSLWIEGATEAESGRLTVVGNRFVDSGGSGIILHGGATPIEDVVIQGNIVKHTSKKSSAVQLGNAHRVQFVANTIVDGEVVCGYLQDFMISNNIIVGGSGLGLAGLRLYARISNGSVTGNIIRAEATSRGVEVQYHNAQPTKIRLAQNTIVAGDTGIAVNGQDISVSDNLIEKDPDGPGEVGISVALGDTIQVCNNQVRDFQYGILAAGDQGDLTPLVIVGNQIRGSSPSPTGAAIHIKPRVQATVYGNQAGPGETLLKLESAYIVTAAGFAGNGPPEGVVAAAVGSLYTQLERTPSLWVKETGTDSQGWRQVVPALLPPSNPVSP